MKIAFVASEVFPFAKTGGLADITGILPLVLEKLGLEVVICLPHYSIIKGITAERLSSEISRVKIGRSVEVLLIESEKYFHRTQIYGDAQGDYKDNLDRFEFFCTQSLKALKEFHPDLKIVHCHDWQTALIPVYLKEKFKNDPFYSSLKSVLTIHNLAFQGVFKKEEFSKLGLKDELFSDKGFEFYGKVNLLKAGIIYADKVTTVSSQYAKEILTHQYGCGLEGVLNARRDGVTGILNGIDQDVWNPATDPFIVEKYSAQDYLKGKLKNKLWLQEQLNFQVSGEIPLIGFVGRLSHQKGVDLFLESIDELVKMEVQIFIQGIGEEKYHSLLSELAYRYKGHVAVLLEFEERVARSIYGGSDLFMMPSHFEPCGLSQMIALRYGSIPIVYKTGGLVDTIKNFDIKDFTGNGFCFEQYSKDGFLKATSQAVDLFKQKPAWEKIVENAFNSDYSWQKSALHYKELYQCM